MTHESVEVLKAVHHRSIQVRVKANHLNPSKGGKPASEQAIQEYTRPIRDLLHLRLTYRRDISTNAMRARATRAAVKVPSDTERSKYAKQDASKPCVEQGRKQRRRQAAHALGRDRGDRGQVHGR
jgi:hypothetical protein